MRAHRPTTVGRRTPSSPWWLTVSRLVSLYMQSWNQTIPLTNLPISCLCPWSSCLPQLAASCPVCRSAPSPSTTAGRRPSGSLRSPAPWQLLPSSCCGTFAPKWAMCPRKQTKAQTARPKPRRTTGPLEPLVFFTTVHWQLWMLFATLCHSSKMWKNVNRCNLRRWTLFLHRCFLKVFYRVQTQPITLWWLKICRITFKQSL